MSDRISVEFCCTTWEIFVSCKYFPGPSCSKLMTSLVNDSLKFTSSAKATHIFSAKNIRILYIESAKTVNEMTLNELVKLTRL